MTDNIISAKYCTHQKKAFKVINIRSSQFKNVMQKLYADSLEII